jgi:uncharacterized membrane protein YGL010W
MKTLEDQLSGYADYHRDPRNIATHLIGIPMIVIATAILLARPSVLWLDIHISLATLLLSIITLYYLRLDLRYGIVMGLFLLAASVLGQSLVRLPTAQWLLIGGGLFVVGWILQFIGHYFEGRKPAFVDDLLGLAIGPLFVLAEMGFFLGLRSDLKAVIESRCGPVRRKTA